MNLHFYDKDQFIHFKYVRKNKSTKKGRHFILTEHVNSLSFTAVFLRMHNWKETCATEITCYNLLPFCF